MPLKRKGEAWADGIRAQIKAECGLGWTLRNHVQRGVVTGNTQLTHRNSDGQRPELPAGGAGVDRARWPWRNK